MKSTIEQHFKTHQIPFVKHTHPAVFTCEDVCDRYKEYDIPNQKSLVLTNKKKSQFWMFTVQGDRKTDLKKLYEITGERLSFAGPDHLQSLLHTYAGACSPFGLVFDTDHKVEFYIEDHLMKNPFLGFHPNDNTKTWKVSRQDFQKFIESLGRPWREVQLD